MNTKLAVEKNTKEIKQIICDEMLDSLTDKLLEKWYPLAIDKDAGGYYTNISFDFRLMHEQEKMIVTQARHMWTNAKAAEFFDSGRLLQVCRSRIQFHRK